MTAIPDHIAKVKELRLPSSEFVLVGGSILAIHGIRESDDVDVVVSKRAFEELKKHGWKVDPAFKEKWKRERLTYDVFEIYNDVFVKKTNTLLPFEGLLEHIETIDGVQCQTLQHLIFIKLDNGRMKDLEDVALIREYQRI